MTIELTLTDEDIKFLRKHGHADPQLDTYYRVCPVCARADWYKSQSGTGKTIAEVGDAYCDACNRFASRSPDVFDFIMQMRLGQQFIAQRTKATPSPSPSHSQT